MKKRFLAIMLMLCMMFQATANARMNITGDSLPEGWTQDISDNALISVSNGVIRTEYNAENATGKANVISEPFAVNDSIGFYVNCTFNISGVDSRTYRSIQVTDGKISANLISIKNTQLTAFGETVEVSENTDIKTELWVDINKGRAVLKVNDNLVFSGENDELKSAIPGMDKTALSIKFRNYRILKGTITAVSELSNIIIDTIGDYESSANIENDGAFKIGEETELRFNFGSPMSYEVAEKSNISLTMNDETLDFDSSYDGETLIIAPENNFEALGKYKLIISEAKNIFGEVVDKNIEIVFTVTDNTYSKPEISLTVSKTSAMVGENVEIDAETVTSQQGIVKIFINNQCVTEGTENNLKYTLSENAGTYEVYAEVTDGLGIVAKSDKITVTFKENDAPNITMTGLEDTYGGIDGEEIYISASDNDGIDRLEIYLNDVLYYEGNETTKLISLAGFAYGKYTMSVTAYDVFGLTNTSTAEFSVIGFQHDILYKDDFSTYTTTAQSTTLTSGILLAGQRGYVKPDVIDEEHGTSLIIGMDEINPGFNEGDRPYVGLDTCMCSGKNICDFEIYIDETPVQASPGTMTLKQAGGAEVVIATIYDGQFHFSGVNVPFETKHWYTISVEIDVAGHKYSISLNDGTGNKKVVSNAGLANAMTVCNWLRVGGPTDNSVKTFYALDNVKVYKEVNYPVITRIGYNGMTDTNQIICNPETIDIYLSAPLANVVEENVLISDNGIAVGIEEAVYDAKVNCVKVKLKNKLRSNTTYTVVLVEGTKAENGAEIDRDIMSSFVTALEGSDIISAAYSGGNIKFTVRNNSSNEEKLYAVAAVYNGDKFVRSAYAPIEAKAETTIDGTINIGTLSNGETAELYLWKVSDGTIRTISSKIYCFK